MAKWFGVHYNQEDRFGSAVKYKKGPPVLTLLLIKDKNIIIDWVPGIPSTLIFPAQVTAKFPAWAPQL